MHESIEKFFLIVIIVELMQKKEEEKSLVYNNINIIDNAYS